MGRSSGRAKCSGFRDWIWVEAESSVWEPNGSLVFDRASIFKVLEGRGVRDFGTGFGSKLSPRSGSLLGAWFSPGRLFSRFWRGEVFGISGPDLGRS